MLYRTDSYSNKSEPPKYIKEVALMPTWTEINSGSGNYDMWMEDDIGKQRNKHRDPQIKKAGLYIV